jgi:crossover junction endodeoxyribonuclease RusA
MIHTFDWVRPPLSANDRMHWRKKAAITADIRTAARLAFAQHPPVSRVEVRMTWVVTTKHRRDADNTVPTLKAICDGLVDAGIVPDDTPEFMVKHMPVIVMGDRAGVRVEVTAL